MTSALVQPQWHKAWRDRVGGEGSLGCVVFREGQNTCEGQRDWRGGTERWAFGGPGSFCVLLDPFPSHTCISEPLARPRAWASSGVSPVFSVLLTVGTKEAIFITIITRTISTRLSGRNFCYNCTNIVSPVAKHSNYTFMHYAISNTHFWFGKLQGLSE